MSFRNIAFASIGFILVFAFAAHAATVTITIPAELVSRYVDAWSIGKGWTDDLDNVTGDPTPDGLDDTTGLSKADYAKTEVRKMIRKQLIHYEAYQAGESAENSQRSSSESETETITVN